MEHNTENVWYAPDGTMWTRPPEEGGRPFTPEEVEEVRRRREWERRREEFDHFYNWY